MFSITFEYDEQLRKWEVYASGAMDQVEALQGLCAVLLTARKAVPHAECNQAELQPDGRWKFSIGKLPETNVPFN